MIWWNEQRAIKNYFQLSLNGVKLYIFDLIFIKKTRLSLMLYMNETVNKWADYKILQLIVLFIYLIHTYIIINCICEQITESPSCRACTGHTHREGFLFFKFIVFFRTSTSAHQNYRIMPRKPCYRLYCFCYWYLCYILLQMHIFIFKVLFFHIPVFFTCSNAWNLTVLVNSGILGI